MITLELTVQELFAIKFALTADLETVLDTINWDGYAKKAKKHDLWPQASAIKSVLDKVNEIEGGSDV